MYSFIAVKSLMVKTYGKFLDCKEIYDDSEYHGEKKGCNQIWMNLKEHGLHHFRNKIPCPEHLDEQNT